MPQSAILACRWAKLDLLLTSYDVWIRQHAGQRAYFTRPKMSEESFDRRPEPPSLGHQVYKVTDGPHVLRPPNMSMREKVDFDLANFSRMIYTVPRHSDCVETYAFLATRLEVHPATTIPRALLSGPFDTQAASAEESIALGEEKARRLFWLVRSGARLQDHQTWELTWCGFQAILQVVTKSLRVECVPGGESNKWLEVALQLFVLFDALGVFGSQWPPCKLLLSRMNRLPKTLTAKLGIDIVNTNFDSINDCIAKVPSGSVQESLLRTFASLLKNYRRVHIPTWPDICGRRD